MLEWNDVPSRGRRRWWVATILLAVLIGVVGAARGDELAEGERFGALSRLIGRWEGTAEKPDGTTPGVVEAVYAYTLDGTFLRAETLIAFPSETPDRNVDLRRELVYVSYDVPGGRYRARAFASQGFVGLESVVLQEGGFVRTSESIENGPDGMQTRITTRFDNEDELTEVVEVAMPGLGFQLYQTRRLRRVADY